MPKWALANSMDLYLYPRHFEPLFREFFRKAARFRSRQNVEFEQDFLLVLPNAHSKHRCGTLAICAAFRTYKPQASPIPLQDETAAY